jgi:ribulose bisphosphate carboxylase small subunit
MDWKNEMKNYRQNVFRARARHFQKFMKSSQQEITPALRELYNAGFIAGVTYADLRRYRMDAPVRKQLKQLKENYTKHMNFARNRAKQQAMFIRDFVPVSPFLRR